MNEDEALFDAIWDIVPDVMKDLIEYVECTEDASISDSSGDTIDERMRKNYINGFHAGMAAAIFMIKTGEINLLLVGVNRSNEN